jgi:imidazolonepropionase-like amidohydrolase
MAPILAKAIIANGMATADAIMAAISRAADLIGAVGDISRVQRGLRANIVAVPVYPLTDTAAFERVDFVMKGGAIFRYQNAPVAVGAN